MMQHNTRLFITVALLYAIHLCIKYCSLAVPALISSHFADILCMPFTLSLFVIVVRFLKREATFQLSFAMIVFAVLYISLVFEFLLPRFYPRHTADIIDIACYSAGGMFYFFFQKWETARFEVRKHLSFL